MSVQGEHVETAKVLLTEGAPIDDVTVDYLTALHVAAHCGHVKVKITFSEVKMISIFVCEIYRRHSSDIYMCEKHFQLTVA